MMHGNSNIKNKINSIIHNKLNCLLFGNDRGHKPFHSTRNEQYDISNVKFAAYYVYFILHSEIMKLLNICLMAQ
jgi:hypothetical protein